jgi:large subunit ribosomal protein L23
MNLENTQVIIRPLVTEKSVDAAQHQNTYLFEVHREANKTQIRNAVQKLFSVKVESIRTVIRKGKMRRVKYSRGRTRAWKKAVVRLVPGDTIEFI